MVLRILALIGLLLPAMTGVSAKEARLNGLSDPTLAMNVAVVADWDTAKPFINLAHTMRSFFAIDRKGKKIPRSDLPKDLYDKHGWVKFVPNEAKYIQTIWHWSKALPGADEHIGHYVLTYEGEGDLTVDLDAKITSRRPGRIEFRNVSGGPISLKITSTDPNQNGRYLRNIKLFRKKHEALYQAGALFNPDWLKAVADAHQIRFMNWMKTNGSHQKQWDGRPRLDDATWSTGRGVPVEVMVRLANEIGADPWFTMPHMATPEYNRAFAEYVRDNLDPRLKAYVEFSNELWNTQFRQSLAMISEAKAMGGGMKNNGVIALRARAVMQIWEDVFGDASDKRIVRVLGSMKAVPDWTKRLLKHDAPPDLGGKSGKLSDGFDVLAVASYIGGGRHMIGRMLEAWRAGPDNLNGRLKSIFEDPAYQSSPTIVAERLRYHAHLARKAGLKLIAYEGGQHLHAEPVHRTGGIEFNRAIEAFVFSDEMAAIYSDWWRAWRDIGDGPFMHFTAIGRSSKYGSWGLQRYLGEANPRWRALTELNAKTGSWWGEGGGPHRQQGDLSGTHGLIGTAEEDYLIGSEEDDEFHPSTGSDGLNGRGGYDIVHLPSPRNLYTIDHRPPYVVVSRRPNSPTTSVNETKSLFGIEEIRFSDRETFVISN